VLLLLLRNEQNQTINSGMNELMLLLQHAMAEMI
jgi:hypothetical protein